MTPYPQAARYNFLSRSVRLGGKHNVRASILASSLSEVNLELHSFKGSSSTGPPSLVLHSSRWAGVLDLNIYICVEVSPRICLLNYFG